MSVRVAEITKRAIESEETYKLGVKVPIHIELLVRPLCDSSLTEGHFSPYIQSSQKDKNAEAAPLFSDSVCMCTFLPAYVRQLSKENLQL